MPTATTRPDKPESTVMAEETTKDSYSPHTLSKFDYDLYKEDDDVKLPIIRVKYVELPHNGARWKVSSDNKMIFVIEGSKLNKKEKEFLRTINGANFILSCAKLGFTSLNKFRKELKNHLSDEVSANAVQKQGRREKK